MANLRNTSRIGLALVALAMVAVSCTSDEGSSPDTTLGTAELPADILEVMNQPRYADATWLLLARDVETGETFYSLNADQMAFTGSTRKLFSVGSALTALGPDARQTTSVHREGEVAAGTLDGDLVLVAGGDLTFGGRRIDADTVEYTNLDHNDANNLGGSQLTPQDPLYGLDQLAAQVKASGIDTVSGDVVVDARYFEPYRVPNGNLLITPMIVNDNQVDVSVTPTETGQPATVEYRPRTEAFTVDGSVVTAAAGTESDLALGGTEANITDQGALRLIECLGQPGCSGTVEGDIATDYEAPLSGDPQFVQTFRVEDPDTFARIAFIDALRRSGVTVTAPSIAPNDAAAVPAESPTAADTEVAAFESAPYAQNARLVLKVSLNLGANLSLSLFGLTEGEDTVDGALAAERTFLTETFGIDGTQFDFPTNGSGSPDSEASPEAIVDLLVAMAKTPNAEVFKNALPILGVDGSLASTGTDLPAKGKVFAKTGTTVGAGGADGETPVLVAQNLAGYIETKSGRTIAYALMVNNAGELPNFEEDIGAVFTDEAVISNILYETL